MSFFSDRTDHSGESGDVSSARRITEKPSQLVLCEKGLQEYVQWCESTNSGGTDNVRWMRVRAWSTNCGNGSEKSPDWARGV